jgi:hypothetical protein
VNPAADPLIEGTVSYPRMHTLVELHGQPGCLASDAAAGGWDDRGGLATLLAVAGRHRTALAARIASGLQLCSVTSPASTATKPNRQYYGVHARVDWTGAENDRGSVPCQLPTSQAAQTSNPHGPAQEQ